MAVVYFVSLDGDDTNSGTEETQPLRHVQKGIDKLTCPGDVLKIRGGTYIESVIITDKFGDDTSSGSIRVESYEGEPVRIDAGYTLEDAGAIRFRNTPNGLWHLANDELQEYVSKLEFRWNEDNRLNRGAFVDLMPYTRLICYSNINDLRSTNERYGRLREGEAPDGPLIVDEHGEFIDVINADGISKSRDKRPWVYMGPGIFHNPDDGRVHVRLAPTHHEVADLPEYQGEADPNNLSLSLSRESTSTLTIRNCHHVVFRDISVRFGAETVRVRECQDVQFDHVRIYAGGKGVDLGSEASSNIVFSNCEFDGGLPSWFFRTDEKGEYRFKDAEDAPVQENKLAAGTSGLPFAGPTNGASSIEIHHCEFANGHDLQLVGDNFSFHDNWVDNMQDDALAVGFGLNSGDIFLNIITRCQTAMSFAGSAIGGPYRITSSTCGNPFLQSDLDPTTTWTPTTARFPPSASDRCIKDRTTWTMGRSTSSRTPVYRLFRFDGVGALSGRAVVVGASLPG